MSHAITIGGLLLSAGILVGLLAALFGLMMVFAGGMSDAPSEGNDASRQGCIVFIVGVVLLAGCIAGMVL